MISETLEQTIKTFFPSEPSDLAQLKLILEWLDAKQMKIEEKIMELERKYKMSFSEFDEKVRSSHPPMNEEDDWIDWGDYGELVQLIRNYRKGILSQLQKLSNF